MTLDLRPKSVQKLELSWKWSLISNRHLLFLYRTKPDPPCMRPQGPPPPSSILPPRVPQRVAACVNTRTSLTTVQLLVPPTLPLVLPALIHTVTRKMFGVGGEQGRRQSVRQRRLPFGGCGAGLYHRHPGRTPKLACAAPRVCALKYVCVFCAGSVDICWPNPIT